jgi:hypothetical protein
MLIMNIVTGRSMAMRGILISGLDSATNVSIGRN